MHGKRTGCTGSPSCPELDAAGEYAAVIGAVAHDAYRTLGADALSALLAPGGLLADVKGLWPDLALPDGLRRWLL